MTEPEQPSLWDGHGVDPWLPSRLAAQTAIAEAEAALYQAWWASFSAWIVGVNRAVLRSALPDPHAVWGQAPKWQAEVAGIVNGPIRDTVGLSYNTLFGEGYEFDSRPAVVEHLAGVTNRMVRTPDQVFDLVASTVSRGAGQGDSIPVVAERIDEILSTTGTEQWRGRATVVSRTETLSALNAGRSDSFAAVAEALGDDFESLWLSTADARTRPDHVEADGQRVPLGQPFTVGGEPLRYPGDPSGSAENIINCVVGDTLVEYPGLRAVTRRWYEGDVIQLSFASGHQLTVTPNHPVLRSDGRWTAAGLLREGDYCISCAGLDRPHGAPDEDRRPAEIGEVYRAANELRHAERIALSPPDFHGDGLDGEVEVIAVDRALDINAQPASDEEIEQFGFALADQARAGVGVANGLAMTLQVARSDRRRNVPRAAGRISGRCEPGTLLIAERSHSEQVCFTSSAGGQPEVLGQPIGDDAPADAQCSSNRLHAFAPVVASPQVSHVDGDTLSQQARLTGATQAGTGLLQAPRNRHRGDSECGSEGGDGVASLIALAQRGSVDLDVPAQPVGLRSGADTSPGGFEVLKDSRRRAAQLSSQVNAGLASLIAPPQAGQVSARQEARSGATDLAHAAHPYPGGFEPAIDDARRDAAVRSDGGGRFPRLIAATKLVYVGRYSFAGHVFNLDTGDGWYIANGIATRNCRCTTLLVRPGESVDLSGRQFVDWETWDQ